MSSASFLRSAKAASSGSSLKLGSLSFIITEETLSTSLSESSYEPSPLSLTNLGV